MTKRELQLFEIAKEVIEKNKDIGAKLTGSLMLAVMGLAKRREAADIDIICDYLCEKEEGLPNVPKGFYIVSMDGGRSEVEAIQFINDNSIKVEFMTSEESAIMINDIKCGGVEWLIEAKQRYAKNDKNDQSREKHELDLEYLFKNNKNL